MRAYLLLFCLVGCGGIVEGQQSTGGTACDKKVCPNDPEPTASQIQGCTVQRSKTASCKACDAYSACVNTHQKEFCGADGKTDPVQAIKIISTTCKPTDACVTCLSM